MVDLGQWWVLGASWCCLASARRSAAQRNKGAWQVVRGGAPPCAWVYQGDGRTLSRRRRSPPPRPRDAAGCVGGARRRGGAGRGHALSNGLLDSLQSLELFGVEVRRAVAGTWGLGRGRTLLTTTKVSGATFSPARFHSHFHGSLGSWWGRGRTAFIVEDKSFALTLGALGLGMMAVLVLICLGPRVLVSTPLAGLHQRRGGRDDNLRHAEAWGSRATSTLPLWGHQATVTAGPGQHGARRGATTRRRRRSLRRRTEYGPGLVPTRQL